MVCQGARTLGMSLTVMGWLLAVVACSLPMWKVTAVVGADAVPAQVMWSGVWMACVLQSSGQMQCKAYDSVLPLPRDLQAARGMMVLSIVTGVCGAVVSVIGGKRTKCIENERSKAKAWILAGAFFIISGLLCLTPVSWSYTTITSFSILEAQTCELGAALYVGWAAAALLLIGGALLCRNCPPKYEHPSISVFAR